VIHQLLCNKKFRLFPYLKLNSNFNNKIGYSYYRVAASIINFFKLILLISEPLFNFSLNYDIIINNNN
jgi:hypothetical protein